MNGRCLDKTEAEPGRAALRQWVGLQPGSQPHRKAGSSFDAEKIPGCYESGSAIGPGFCNFHDMHG